MKPLLDRRHRPVSQGLDAPSNHSGPRGIAGTWGKVLGSGVVPALVGLIAVSVGLSFSGAHFASAANGVAIGYYAAIVGLLTIGETIVLITGGVDLSTGPLLGVSGMTGAVVILNGHASPALGILACLGTGLVGGVANGLLVAYARITPLIATLGVGSVATGCTLLLSKGGNTLAPLPAAYTWFGSATIGIVPVLLIGVVVLYIAGEMALRRTVFGRDLYSIGGNVKAAILAGIPRNRRLLTLYALAGLCYGVAGLAETGFLDAATSAAGQSQILPPIAAAVIGGVALVGGRGSLLGALVGVVFVATIEDGMAILNIASSYTPIVYGLVVVAAVGLGSIQGGSFLRRNSTGGSG